MRGVRNRKTFSARGANERITGARNCGGKEEEEAWTNLRRLREVSASYASSHSDVDSVLGLVKRWSQGCVNAAAKSQT